MIFLYNEEYDACKRYQSQLWAIGARQKSSCGWYYPYDLTDELREKFKALGIGVDDPLDRLTDEFKKRVDSVLSHEFWSYKMAEKTQEIDLRKGGSILFVTDREGYGFSAVCKTGTEYTHVSVKGYYRDRIDRNNLKSYIYRNPIKKVVFHHDFFDRLPDYDPESKITEADLNILEDVPLPHPEPDPPESDEVITTSGGVASSSIRLFPVAGTKIRINLRNDVEPAKFWDGELYKNKEWLKSKFGAKWDNLNKVWYLSKAPTESGFKEISEKGIQWEVADDTL